jgi:hypothetical protein
MYKVEMYFHWKKISMKWINKEWNLLFIGIFSQRKSNSPFFFILLYDLSGLH